MISCVLKYFADPPVVRSGSSPALTIIVPAPGSASSYVRSRICCVSFSYGAESTRIGSFGDARVEIMVFLANGCEEGLEALEMVSNQYLRVLRDRF